MFIDGVLHHTGTSNVNVTENGGVTIGRIWIFFLLVWNDK